MFVYLLGGSKENKVTYEHCSNQSTGYSPTSFTIIFFYRTIIYINMSVFDFYFGAESHITEL